MISQLRVCCDARDIAASRAVRHLDGGELDTLDEIAVSVQVAGAIMSAGLVQKSDIEDFMSGCRLEKGRLLVPGDVGNRLASAIRKNFHQLPHQPREPDAGILETTMPYVISLFAETSLFLSVEFCIHKNRPNQLPSAAKQEELRRFHRRSLDRAARALFSAHKERTFSVIADKVAVLKKASTWLRKHQ